MTRNHALRMTAAVALVGILSLAGCAGTTPDLQAKPTAAVLTPLAELPILADPKAYVGPSTAVLPDTAITPVADDPSQSLPATVTSYDQAGENEVVVTDTSRVVAIDLAGSVAATVWGLGFGHTMVGRDASTTFPGASDLPLVTSGGHTVNAESIVALKPTLVITDGTVGPRDVIEQLRDVGIAVVSVHNEGSFDGAAELARQVAGVYGAPDAGETLAKRIVGEVAEKIAEIAEIAPQEPDKKLRIVFLYLRGGAGIYYLFGAESGADRLITALGAIDIASEQGWVGMRPMTDEALVAADPDLILVMSKGIASVGGVDGLLQEKPAVAITTAGQNRRLVDMDDGSVLSFGPRSAHVLDALARAIYAPDAAVDGGDS